MKNRKRIIMAFVLVACMLIGVGYAAVTSELYAKAHVNLTDDGGSSELDEDVYYTSVTERANCTANVDATDNDSVIFGILDNSSTMAFAGDTATFTAEVKNDAGVAVIVTPRADNISDGITITTDKTEYPIDANGTTLIKFTITLDETVVDQLVIGTAENPVNAFTFDVAPNE